MVNEEEKAKLMAYIHGELEDSESMEIAKRVETDSELRAEIDSIGRTSRQISEHFSIVQENEPDVGLTLDQVVKIRTAARSGRSARNSWVQILGFGGLAAAAFAAVVFYVAHGGTSSKRVEEPVAQNAPIPPPPSENRAKSILRSRRI